MAKAVFLDRDGTINEDPGYLRSPDQIRLFPGAREALARLKRAGFLLVVVSNQSGVARGLIRDGALEAIHDRLNELLGADAAIDHFELCVHHPDDACECRKPKPKLLLRCRARPRRRARRALTWWAIARPTCRRGAPPGARPACSCARGLALRKSRSSKPGEAQAIADRLAEAADWILRQESAGS